MTTMRKIFLFLIACCGSCFALFAQNRIQDTFYGIRLGSSYEDTYSSDFVKENYSDWRYLKKYRQQDFSVQDVWLGGRKWDYCDFYFTGKQQVLYQIRFYHPYKDELVSEDSYDRMLEKLDKKYADRPGIVREAQDDWDENKKEWVSYTDRNGGVCRLEREYRSSTSGTMYNYVFLYYYNNDVKMKVEHSYLEEL